MSLTWQPVAKALAAFDRRRVPPDCVARRLHMANMRPPHALSAGRDARLGATRGFHHGLLAARRARAVAAAVAVPVCAACVQEASAPGPPFGPSGLGLSLALTARPDTLVRDGRSQSVIEIAARDAGGDAVPRLELALQIATARGLEDFGRLARRSVVTGADGRAAVTYTAPGAAGGPGGATDDGLTVAILATPVGRDHAGAVPRRVTIRLLPAGRVLPPLTASAGFRVTPAAPAVFDRVHFTSVCSAGRDADCVRDPHGMVTGYRWEFGDGHAASGPVAEHAYEAPGAYLVSLIVSDDFDRSRRASRSLVVAAAPPAAVIAASPVPVAPHAPIFFNGRGSTAAPGRAIASYEWDFGDGATAAGVRVRHAYVTEGTFTVMLMVTDDRRQVATATAKVVVKALSRDPAPAADDDEQQQP